MFNNVTNNQLNEILEQIEKDKIQKIVVGAVIFIEENTPLLLKRRNDDFMGDLVELPSGTLEPNEDFIAGLIREVKEETGLNIKTIESFCGTFDYISGSGKKTRQVNFKVTTYNNDVTLSSEHEAFFTYQTDSEEYKNLNISLNTKNIIKQAVKLNKFGI